MAPIGKGQRCLLVASPQVGKTVMLQHIAKSIAARKIHTETTVDWVLGFATIMHGCATSRTQRSLRISKQRIFTLKR